MLEGGALRDVSSDQLFALLAPQGHLYHVAKARAADFAYLHFTSNVAASDFYYDHLHNGVPVGGLVCAATRITEQGTTSAAFHQAGILGYLAAPAVNNPFAGASAGSSADAGAASFASRAHPACQDRRQDLKREREIWFLDLDVVHDTAPEPRAGSSAGVSLVAGAHPAPEPRAGSSARVSPAAGASVFAGSVHPAAGARSGSFDGAFAAAGAGSSAGSVFSSSPSSHSRAWKRSFEEGLRLLGDERQAKRMKLLEVRGQLDHFGTITAALVAEEEALVTDLEKLDTEDQLAKNVMNFQ